MQTVWLPHAHAYHMRRIVLTSPNGCEVASCTCRAALKRSHFLSVLYIADHEHGMRAQCWFCAHLAEDDGRLTGAVHDGVLRDGRQKGSRAILALADAVPAHEPARADSSTSQRC